MKVVPQALVAHLSNGQMYDFSVNFLIVNPANASVEAFYMFDKYGSGRKPITEQGFIGADFDDAVGKPFTYDSLAGKVMDAVDAQVDLTWATSHKFAITVARPKLANFSLDLAFRGKRPDWLGGSKQWPGKLMMYEVKGFK
jgi:hypothetical protein